MDQTGSEISENEAEDLTDQEFIDLIKNHVFRFTNKNDALLMLKINRYILNHWTLREGEFR